MLSEADQRLAIYAYHHAAQSMAAYGAGPEVSPFSSKFDYALAKPTAKVQILGNTWQLLVSNQWTSHVNY
jgi:hypothetical protein